VLPTEVWLPARATSEPLVVMAHGLDGDPDALGDLAETWARAGYDVAAPMFPTTLKDAAGNSARSETALQAGDLRFVLDRMLAGNQDRRSPWFGRIDPAHLGAAGMSLGGLAVYAATTGSCCIDRRIDAAVLMAAVHRDVPDSGQRPNRVPMMLLQGDADPGYHNSRDAFSDLVAPKWFVTLHGARHGPPFESPRGSEATVVDATTIAFWDASLRHDATGEPRIVAAVRAHRATTSLQDDPGPGTPAAR
jgi:dienelactone hydrolase